MYKRILTTAALLCGVLLFLMFNFANGVDYYGDNENSLAAGKMIDALEQEEIKKAIVKIEAGAWWGSGIIWDVVEYSVLADYCDFNLDREALNLDSDSDMLALVVTNRHIILNNDSCRVKLSELLAESASEQSVQSGSLPSEIYREGRVIKSYEKEDLALIAVSLSGLAINEIESLKTIAQYWQNNSGFDNPSASDEGDYPIEIYAMGIGENGQPEAVEGSLVDTSFYYDMLDNTFLFTYCPVSPGMSGGGLFDPEGRLLGIVEGGNEVTAETLGIPLSVMKKTLHNEAMSVDKCD